MFEDRIQAGVKLAVRLRHLRDENPVVLALPRGGVPVGFEVARALKAPLDVLLVRKIGAPFQPELAVGAVVDGDYPEILRESRIIAQAGVTEDYILAEAARQLKEIARRRKLYFGRRAPIDITGRTAILVDDGIATGATVRVALRALARRGPSKRVLAVPVAPADTIAELTPEVDEVVCLEMPEPFYAIGNHYMDFHQLDDDEVMAYLDQAGLDQASLGQTAGP